MSLRNPGKRLLTRKVEQAPYLIYEQLPLSLEINIACPSIRRIVTSLQPLAGFQAVKCSQ